MNERYANEAIQLLQDKLADNKYFPYRSSAVVCLEDAMACQHHGDFGPAAERADKGLKYCRNKLV